MSDRYLCSQVDGVAEELALGTLTGDDRAEAVAHVASCARCRAVVGELAAASEALLLLAPEEEPPVGFETSVLDATRAVAVTSPAAVAAVESRASASSVAALRWRRLRRRRPAFRLAAAAAALLVALGAGLVAGRSSAPGGSGGVKTALAVAEGGRATCRAVVIAGHPAQLVVSIDEPPEPEPADYVVAAEPSGGGPTETVGSFTVAAGHGSLSAPISAGVQDVKAIRVFEAGQLRYEARF